MSCRPKAFDSYLAAAVTMALALGIQSGNALAGDSEPVAQTAPPADALSGQIAVIDKHSGKLRGPTAEETAELEQEAAKHAKPSSQRSAAPLVQQNASGVKSMVVGEEYLNYEMAHIRADGTLVHDCVDGSHAAKEWLKNPPAALETE